jgi:hypothetical protein
MESNQWEGLSKLFRTPKWKKKERRAYVFGVMTSLHQGTNAGHESFIPYA